MESLKIPWTEFPPMKRCVISELFIMKSKCSGVVVTGIGTTGKWNDRQEISIRAPLNEFSVKIPTTMSLSFFDSTYYRA